MKEKRRGKEVMVRVMVLVAVRVAGSEDSNENLLATQFA
jgi:hypothetical protein